MVNYDDLLDCISIRDIPSLALCHDNHVLLCGMTILSGVDKATFTPHFKAKPSPVAPSLVRLVSKTQGGPGCHNCSSVLLCPYPGALNFEPPDVGRCPVQSFVGLETWLEIRRVMHKSPQLSTPRNETLMLVAARKFKTYTKLADAGWNCCMECHDLPALLKAGDSHITISCNLNQSLKRLEQLLCCLILKDT